MLTLLVVLVLVLLVGFPIFFVLLGGTLTARVERLRKESIADSEGILNRTFDGSGSATFKTSSASIPYGTVILGAKERGYRVLSQAGRSEDDMTIVFEKIA